MAYLLGVLVALVISIQLYAADLGVYGQRFPIVEENLLEWIRSEIVWDEEGLSIELKEKLLSSIEEPHVVLSLPNAIEDRSSLFDPTITLKRSVHDARGKMLYSAGHRFNPLDVVDFSSALLFINGFDEEQVQWARSQTGKWILVAGRPFDLAGEEERQLFFDQGGYLVRRLGIRALPARVSQEGKQLRIEEIAMEESI